MSREILQGLLAGSLACLQGNGICLVDVHDRWVGCWLVVQAKGIIQPTPICLGGFDKGVVPITSEFGLRERGNKGNAFFDEALGRGGDAKDQSRPR